MGLRSGDNDFSKIVLQVSEAAGQDAFCTRSVQGCPVVASLYVYA